MLEFVQQIIDGASSGLIYASLALALVIIYRSTHQINFAQGELAVFSTYIAVSLIAAGLPYWVAFVLAMAASFLLGVAIERLLLRPLAGAPPLNAVIVFIGLFAITNSLSGWIWGTNIRTFPSPFGEGRWYEGGFLSQHQVGMAGVIVVEFLIVLAFFRLTNLGLCMRAAAENPQSSAYCGIQVNRMLALGWGMAAAIGAVAGMLSAPLVFLDPNMMGGPLIYAFAAALLGGLESPFGAVVGGLIVGIVEALCGTYVVGSELKLSVALALIVATLLLKPSGLFGQASVSRA